MQIPTKKLWRKIGLQKNFLEGTSHSEQSKCTLSQLQQSLVRSHCSQSNNLREAEASKIQPKKPSHEDDMLNQIKNEKKQLNFDQGSCQTPINKLNSSNCNDRDLIWQAANDTIDLIDENNQSGSLCNSQEKYSQLYFQSQSSKYRPKYNQVVSISQTQPNKPTQYHQAFSGTAYPIKNQRLLKEERAPTKTSISQIKIRLHGAEEKQPQTQESSQKRNIKLCHNNQEQSEQYKYTLQIDARNLQKYQRLESQLNQLRACVFPKFSQLIQQLRKCFHLQKTFIMDQISLMRQSMSTYIQKQLAEQIQQLTDEIGYLYSENQSLMAKIQEKQSIIKKHHEQYSKVQQKFSQYSESIRNQQQQKESKITALQNQINKLQQKLQDAQELQTKNQILNKKNNQLLNQMSILASNQIKFTQIMDQKTFQLSASLIKNQQLEWEINELYVKNEQLESNFKKELNQKIQTLENQHLNRLNLEKTFLDKQKSKKTSLQSALNFSLLVFQQTLNHLPFPLIQSLHQQFDIQRSQCLKDIFEKAIHSAQSPKKIKTFNDKPQIDSSQLSPKSESDHGNSSNKNLRKTGFFGQVTKPTLNIRLDDIQKRYSTQIPQDQENINEKNEYFQNRPENISQKRKTLHRGDTFSQISQQSGSKQDYAYRTIQPSYARNEQRQWSRQKHNRNESDPIRAPFLDDSITQDLQRVKLSLQQDRANFNVKTYSNTFTNQRFNQNGFNNSKQNPNYSFSEMNFNAFQQNDDRSSITTYEKSQTNHRQRERQRQRQRFMVRNTYNNQRQANDRSDRSNMSSTDDRQDIIEKIKQRVKQKLKSKDKHPRKQTNYPSPTQTSLRRPSYHQAECQQMEDMILVDFYEKHSIRNNPLISQHQTERKISPHSVSRSPSNTRSRSPSNSSATRVYNHNPQVGLTKYTPTGGTSTYGRSNLNRVTMNITPKSTFSKSLIEKPQFVAYSRRNQQPNPMATYQPKSTLYSTNRGDTQTGSTYSKMY